MPSEPVLISVLALGFLALATLLAGQFTIIRHHAQRSATLVQASRARVMARREQRGCRNGNILGQPYFYSVRRH